MIRCILNFRIRQRTVGFPLGFGSAGRLTFRALYPHLFSDGFFLLIVLI